MNIVDLEIRIRNPPQNGSYPVVVRLDIPGSDILRPEAEGWASFDLAALKLGEWGRAADYGRGLTDALFADEKVRRAYDRAAQVAEGMEGALRVRLRIDPNQPDQPDLHEVRWETLRDPGAPNLTLATRRRVFFSRFLVSETDWSRDRPRPRQARRALVVVANPTNLPAGMVPIAVDEVVLAARADLEPEIPMSVLASGGTATEQGIIESLRTGFDVLYLVCHGTLRQSTGEPVLYLEKPDGTRHNASGMALAQRVGRLELRPRLVVLCSCRSAGSGETPVPHDWGMLAAVGPRLALEGVPAVLAMQGDVPDVLARPFLRTFFRQLASHGRIDEAVAEARADVEFENDHYWMPALFLRLKSASLRWYQPRFLRGKQKSGAEEQPRQTRATATSQKEDFAIWPSITERIQAGSCTPILGPRLLSPFIGSPAELATRWLRELPTPLTRPGETSLPLVVQAAAMYFGANVVRDEFRRLLGREIIRIHKPDIAEELVARCRDREPLPDDWPVELLAAAWDARRNRGEIDLHTVLAALPCPVYVDTSPFHLLEQALRDSQSKLGASRWPMSQRFQWLDDRWSHRSAFERVDRDYYPTVDKPLVYHLVGDVRDWDAVPLTEDNILGFQVAFERHVDEMPPYVQRSLLAESLLFIGFPFDDWHLRFMLHEVNRLGMRQSNRLIVVQIDPSDVGVRAAATALDYMRVYLKTMRVHVFWGSAEVFLDELWAHWKQAPTEGRP